MALLREYATRDSEAAFETLVSRRVHFVYSAAMRQARDPHLAEEITQAVFIILAQKAGKISDKTILTGWLFKTTRFAALAQTRAAIKRKQREQEAQMQSEIRPSAPDLLWDQMSPLLDEALAQLGEKDRQAVLLRFFENKNFAEVGSRLGTGEDTARKRVSRALEKLRKYFSKRGVVSTTAIIAGAVSANSVQAAPSALTTSISAAAMTKGAVVSGSTLTLIKGALKLMAWTKAKMAVVVGVGVLLTVTTMVVTTTIIRNFHTPSGNTIYEQIWANPNSDSISLLEKAPPALIIRPTRYPTRGGGLWTDGGKGFWVNGNVKSLVGIAYNWSLVRAVFPDSMPTGNYDVMESLPNGQNAAAFKAEIQKQFGLVAHTEIRDVEVFYVKVKNLGKLQSHVSTGGQPAAYMTGDSKVQNYFFKNKPLKDLAGCFESRFEKPFVDRTGLGGLYNFTFQWKSRMSPEALRQSLLKHFDQFGLELVPGREPIEMLVVEKVK